MKFLIFSIYLFSLSIFGAETSINEVQIEHQKKKTQNTVITQYPIKFIKKDCDMEFYLPTTSINFISIDKDSERMIVYVQSPTHTMFIIRNITEEDANIIAEQIFNPNRNEILAIKFNSYSL